MVVYRDGIQVVPLTTGVAVTLGRSEPADIRAQSRRLSRVHVRFLWDGQAVQVEDLGSTNGSFLNGERIERAVQLGPDDEVTAGSVVVTLHTAGAPAGQLHGVERHERFLQSVEAEIARARTFGRGLAVLQIRPFGGRGMLARWVPRVQQSLRIVDRLGLFSPAAAEVLVAETDIQGARALAASLVSNRGEGEPPLVIGVAVYPQHGSSAEALVSASGDAVAMASLVNPVVPYRYASDQSVDDDGGPVVRNPRMIEIYRTLDRVASSSISVLIAGETGSGKEIVARGIHERSSRRDGPWRAINCGAIPPNLLEAVLFGHERGAFTGADRQRPGVFEEAAGGTVLLDEIGELSQAAQVALLRVLEERSVTRVGGREEISVDVRVVAATHRDLEKMCRSGEFRWDLYYRLNTFTIAVPSLRDRVDEIRPLVRRFIDDANRLNQRAILGASPEALRLLEEYRWPGNVRELRNAVERAVVIAVGEYLTVDDLPDSIRTRDGRRRSEPDEMAVDDNTDTSGVASGGEADLEPLKLAVARLERRLICGALRSCDGNQTRAAEVLGLPRRTLVYKMRGYAIGEEYRRVDPLPLEQNSMGKSLDFGERVATFEREQISLALDRARGDVAAAAALLGVQKRTLERKLGS